MIPRKNHRILVQGITGKQGTFWTEAMIAYGSNVIGGVNPKKAGSEHLGVPVFATAREAAKSAPFDIACMFIPPMLAKDAAIDACEAGARLLVCLTEHIPSHDVMEIHVAARQNRAERLRQTGRLFQRFGGAGMLRRRPGPAPPGCAGAPPRSRWRSRKTPTRNAAPGPGRASADR